MKKISMLCMAAVMNLSVMGLPLFAAEANNAQPKSIKAASSDQKAATYVCPMHSEVTSDKPGKCPECGMFLEKKSTAPAKKATAKKSEPAKKMSHGMSCH
jgi:hypothetical protein